MEANHAESTFDATGLTVGVPAAVGVAALMATARSFFGTTNAALVLVIVVVAVAALGGRVVGIVTALAAVVSFDFFHTEPYLSLAIDSRDDIETTVLLLIAGVFVGTIASSRPLGAPPGGLGPGRHPPHPPRGRGGGDGRRCGRCRRRRAGRAA